MSGRIDLNRDFTDFLKLLAALLVAAGHYSGYAITNGHGNAVYSALAATGGYIGVAIFFFFSGYGLMMSENKRHTPSFSFIKRRLVKLYLPVVLVSAIWGVVQWPDAKGIEWIGQYLYLALWEFGDGILWFIKVIILEYLLFAAYIYLNIKTWLREALLWLGTALVYVLVFLIFDNWAAISVPLFTLGIVLAKYESWFYSIVRGKGIFLWLIAITGIMGVSYYLWGNLYAHALLNYYLVTGIIVTGAYSITKTITPPIYQVGRAMYRTTSISPIIKSCTTVVPYMALSVYIIS